MVYDIGTGGYPVTLIHTVLAFYPLTLPRPIVRQAS